MCVCKTGYIRIDDYSCTGKRCVFLEGNSRMVVFMSIDTILLNLIFVRVTEYLNGMLNRISTKIWYRKGNAFYTL